MWCLEHLQYKKDLKEIERRVIQMNKINIVSLLVFLIGCCFLTSFGVWTNFDDGKGVWSAFFLGQLSIIVLLVVFVVFLIIAMSDLSSGRKNARSNK